MTVFKKTIRQDTKPFLTRHWICRRVCMADEEIEDLLPLVLGYTSKEGSYRCFHVLVFLTSDGGNSQARKRRLNGAGLDSCSMIKSSHIDLRFQN